MTDDLVKLLREWAVNYQCNSEWKIVWEAADRIEQLEAALRFYAEYQPAFSHQDFRAVARAALEKSND